MAQRDLKDLKYDQLDGYKNCSLSELLSVIIDSFIPKHHNKYVDLNVRYGDGCKNTLQVFHIFYGIDQSK